MVTVSRDDAAYRQRRRQRGATVVFLAGDRRQHVVSGLQGFGSWVADVTLRLEAPDQDGQVGMQSRQTQRITGPDRAPPSDEPSRGPRDSGRHLTHRVWHQARHHPQAAYCCQGHVDPPRSRHPSSRTIAIVMPGPARPEIPGRGGQTPSGGAAIRWDLRRAGLHRTAPVHRPVLPRRHHHQRGVEQVVRRRPLAPGHLRVSPVPETLARRGIRDSDSLCRQLLADTGVAILPVSVFGRPPKELIARISFVDSGGAQALVAASQLPRRSSPREGFLQHHCGRTRGSTFTGDFRASGRRLRRTTHLRPPGAPSRRRQDPRSRETSAPAEGDCGACLTSDRPGALTAPPGSTFTGDFRASGRRLRRMPHLRPPGRPHGAALPTMTV